MSRKPDKVQMTIRLDPDVFWRIEIQSKQLDRSFNYVLNSLLLKALAEDSLKKK